MHPEDASCSRSFKDLLIKYPGMARGHVCNTHMQNRRFSTLSGLCPLFDWLPSFVRGLKEYLRSWPQCEVVDLYQNPWARPRKGLKHCPVLTTGCARMYLPGRSRFISGVELLLFQSIPVTVQASQEMRSVQLQILNVSNSAHCRLAGNSMHASCIGLILFAVMHFLKAEEA